MTTLSSLSRAGLATKEGYLWINAIAIVLSLVIAVMSWNAYDQQGQADHAMVCIVSQALAIALAILARRAITAQMPLAAAAAFALACGCAWWSSHGLALAWYEDAERNGELMVLFMAALEPGLFLLAEHISEGREVLRAAHAKAEAEEAEALKRAQERDALAAAERLARLAPTPSAAPPAPASNIATLAGRARPKAAAKKPSHVARRVAAGVMAAAAGAAGAPMQAAAAPAAISGAERPANPMPSYDDIDRARYELRNRGAIVSVRGLAAYLGCSRHQIDKAWPGGQPIGFGD